jgi:hypothetical protein
MTGATCGFLGVAAAVLGVVACSGTTLYEVGERNGLAGAPAVGGESGSAGKGAGSGYAAGGEGSPPQAGVGGEGGQSDAGELNCPTCEIVVAGQDVRGIANDDQRLFWVEYGTSDDLGNYQGDGRLLARDLDGGAISVLADSLPGPETVNISSNYLYVFVDQLLEQGRTKGVLRVPLAGGPAETLQSLAEPEYWKNYQVFASTPAYEYWSWDDTIYRIANTQDAVVETFLEGESDPLFADDERLYFIESIVFENTIRSIPLAGGEVTKIATTPVGFSFDQLQLQGEYWFAFESPARGDGSTYLTRMPKAGGSWKRIARTDGSIGSQLSFVGDHYFTDDATASERRVMRRSLTEPDGEVLASAAIPRLKSWAWNGWSASRVGLFFSDSNGLYVLPMMP